MRRRRKKPQVTADGKQRVLPTGRAGAYDWSRWRARSLPTGASYSPLARTRARTSARASPTRGERTRRPPLSTDDAQTPSGTTTVTRDLCFSRQRGFVYKWQLWEPNAPRDDAAFCLSLLASALLHNASLEAPFSLCQLTQAAVTSNSYL